MNCRLCLQVKPLLKKSHIIPDFMYQELYDGKHTMVNWDPSDPQTKQIKQSGAYEGDILCADCDNRIIGEYETYASKLLYGGKISAKITSYKQADGLEIDFVEGVDFRKFKLFLLSLVWRSSISSLPFFRSVQLGPYEEIFRQMILNGDPGCEYDYPFILGSYRRHKLPKELVAAPRKFRFDGKISYMFLVSGFMYILKIIKNEKTDWIREVTPNSKGELRVIHSSEDAAKKTLNILMGSAVFS